MNPVGFLLLACKHGTADVPHGWQASQPESPGPCPCLICNECVTHTAWQSLTLIPLTSPFMLLVQRWLAPEVMRGQRATPAADVFSFAVVSHTCGMRFASLLPGNVAGGMDTPLTAIRRSLLGGAANGMSQCGLPPAGDVGATDLERAVVIRASRNNAPLAGRFNYPAASALDCMLHLPKLQGSHLPPIVD